jgi:hypothetical protein
MRFILLHYHILKNAGTTVESILERNFGAGFARYDSPEPNALIPNGGLLSFLERNPHIRAVSSHQMRYPRPESAGAIFFDLCFLRDPIDRIRSMYDDFRRRPPSDDPVSVLARGSAPGEFVAGLVARHPHLVNDPQVVLLANRGAYDHPPGRADLDRAVDVMLRMSLVGVVDFFNESCVAGQYYLNPVFPALDCAAVPANVSRAVRGGLVERTRAFRAACDRRVYAQLQALNALDEELVARARAEVRRRFELAPDHDARLLALRHRVEAISGTYSPQPSGMAHALGRWGRAWLPHDRFHGA